MTKMLYTDLNSGAAAEHQKDLIAAAANARRANRVARSSRGQRHHHSSPLAAWRSWLEAGRL
jgi:hypothetical protein